MRCWVGCGARAPGWSTWTAWRPTAPWRRCSPPTRSTGSPLRSPTSPAVCRTTWPDVPARSAAPSPAPPSGSPATGWNWSPSAATASMPHSTTWPGCTTRAGPTARCSCGAGSASAAQHGRAPPPAMWWSTPCATPTAGRSPWSSTWCWATRSPSTRPAGAPSASGGGADRCCAPASSRLRSPTGTTEYDLLRGDEPYKAEWATDRRELVRCTWGVGLRGAAAVRGRQLQQSIARRRADRDNADQAPDGGGVSP